jgi:hypothetical protein
MKKWSFVALLVVGATILGSTILREPIASAAQSVSATIVGPLDANGNVAVHEQGTASVHVDNTKLPSAAPATQHLLVDLSGGGSETFGPVDASLIVVYSSNDNTGSVFLYDGNELALALQGPVSGSPNHYVLPLTQPIRLSKASLSQCAVPPCSAEVEIVGS